MRSVPVGQRIQIADVVKALRQGLCDVGDDKVHRGFTLQRNAEANLFMVAANNHKRLAYDRETREIRRIS
jgi:hypothetical protein